MVYFTHISFSLTSKHKSHNMLKLLWNLIATICYCPSSYILSNFGIINTISPTNKTENIKYIKLLSSLHINLSNMEDKTGKQMIDVEVW
jgi:hypothetical protein